MIWNFKKINIIFFLICYFFTVSVAYAKEQTTVRWIGHSGIEITTPKGRVMLIDPWLTNPKAPKELFNYEKVDLILVTNGYSDHLGETVEIIKNTNAELCTFFDLGMQLIEEEAIPKEQATLATLFDVGGNITVFDGEVQISMVKASHSSSIFHEFEDDEDNEILYGGKSVGFVIKIKDGPVIYNTGDTDLFGDMRLIRKLHHPDLLLLPIGGHVTMGPELAAYAVKMISPKWVIPIHYATYPLLAGTPNKFKIELLKLNLKINPLVLAPGEFHVF